MFYVFVYDAVRLFCSVNAKAHTLTPVSSFQLELHESRLPWRRALKSKIGSISVDWISDAHTTLNAHTHTLTTTLSQVRKEVHKAQLVTLPYCDSSNSMYSIIKKYKTLDILLFANIPCVARELQFFLFSIFHSVTLSIFHVYLVHGLSLCLCTIRPRSYDTLIVLLRYALWACVCVCTYEPCHSTKLRTKNYSKPSLHSSIPIQCNCLYTWVTFDYMCGVPRIVRHGDGRSRTVDNKKKNVQRINIFMEQIGQIPKRQAAPSKRIQHIRCLWCFFSGEALGYWDRGTFQLITDSSNLPFILCWIVCACARVVVVHNRSLALPSPSQSSTDTSNTHSLA